MLSVVIQPKLGQTYTQDSLPLAQVPKLSPRH